MGSKQRSSLSRRRVLKTAGAAAVGAGAAALLGARDAAAQAQAPGILTNAQGGRRFRGFVKYSAARPEVVELTARPLTGNLVMIRVEAAQTCYSSVGQVLAGGDPINRALLIGHGGVGVVEAVGPQAISTRVGDRVILNLHDACGRCWNCLWMRSDKCVSAQVPEEPLATMADGTPVFGRRGAMGELAITGEEYITPVFTDLSGSELAMLTCVGGCGLGMTMTNCPVEVASDVVIFGAGPVGLSAVMGARVKGASQIIVVEPIPYRRQLALQLGATAVLDPNDYAGRRPSATGGGRTTDQFQDDLVDRIREMTRQKTDRVWSGGGRNGPDHVIEAVGGDRFKPRAQPQGPDPTGVRALQQCWELGSAIGTIVTSSIGHPRGATVQIPAAQWADGDKHHWPGTGGGTNDRRDSPRYVRLMETGQINMKALAQRTYPLEQAREAYQVCADRDVVATVVTPNA